MKKFFVLFVSLLMAHSLAFADEIINSKGEIIKCKVVTVADGFIEYEKDGCLYKIIRIMNQSVFNDYVDVVTNLSKPITVTRYKGIVKSRDFSGIKMQLGDSMVQIPWYKIKFVGIYDPN